MNSTIMENTMIDDDVIIENSIIGWKNHIHSSVFIISRRLYIGSY